MWRLAWAVLLLAACGGSAGGGGDGDGVPADAASGDPDGNAGPEGDAGGQTSCLPGVPAAYGIATPVGESNDHFDAESWNYMADLASESEPFQRLFVSLHDGMGVFAGGVTPGTYVLEGDETDFSWCGACVYLAVDDDGAAPSVLYMARSGKLRLDSVDTEIHGALTSIDMVQIEIEYTGPSCADPDPWPCGNNACSGDEQLCGQQDPDPGCTSSVASLAF